MKSKENVLYRIRIGVFFIGFIVYTQFIIFLVR